MKRQTPLRRTSALARTTPMKKANRKRRQSEFARAYGSRARVAWVKSRPCALLGFAGAWLCDGEIENAHTHTDGMGRKADYQFIAPLCRKHHREYDGRLLEPFFRGIVVGTAISTERAWQAHLRQSEGS